MKTARIVAFALLVVVLAAGARWRVVQYRYQLAGLGCDEKPAKLYRDTTTKGSLLYEGVGPLTAELRNPEGELHIYLVRDLKDQKGREGVIEIPYSGTWKVRVIAPDDRKWYIFFKQSVEVENRWW